jgi:transcription elongation factor GreA
VRGRYALARFFRGNCDAAIRRRAIDAERAGATHDMVRIGSKVTVVDDENETAVYSIVGSAEANPRQGRISNESPVGQALLGRKVGDSVEVVVPVGTLRYQITEIN